MTEQSVQIPVEAFQPHQWGRAFLKAFDDRKARFFILNWHRRARKTTHALNLLIRECCTQKNQTYLFVAPTYRQAKNIVWRDPNMLSRYLPEGTVVRRQETELFVEFTTGCMLVVRGCDDPDSIRGIDCQGVVFDEFSLHKAEVWEEVIRPIIAQRSDRWAVFAFTPKGMNVAHDYWVNSEKWRDWYRSELRASTSGIIPKGELEKARREMPQETYLQEFECKFSSDALGVFKGLSNVIAGHLEQPSPEYDYVMGLDLAKTQDYNCIIIINRQKRHLDAFMRWNNTSWDITKDRIKAMVRKYNNCLVVPDLTGVGDPIGEDLMRSGVGVFHQDGKPGVKFTNTLKTQMVEKLIVSIEQRLITFPDIEVLLDELRAYTATRLPSGNVRYSAPSGRHDDTVTALMLAVWGMQADIYEKWKPPKAKSRADLFWDTVKADIEMSNLRARGEEAFRAVGDDDYAKV